MDKILDHITPVETNIIKYGQIDDKVLLELKMTTSLFNYIDILTKYYDDEERPYVNTWIDIEGMGYGWAWMKYEENDWHKMMSRLVSEESNWLLRDMDNTLFFIYETKNVKTYHFVTLGVGSYRKDMVINFSNEELYW